ncbi:hypothetical protein AMTR_s00118p00123380 [Amborella trichopoda]|uniref:Major facilitator superfamily (MFS) profile domain-containing protein n=1 Tax=Amborella trichopoda TaxID=13333 RepID=W1NQ37_AMBTC|nr:hypothetical protein AMTR_s00118p00123380 [Amborella trichopoda]
MEDRRGKSSFFNWCYFGVCGGTVVAVSVMAYVQDTLGWGLGFGIPALAMGMGFLVFLKGRGSYRVVRLGGGNPFARIAQVFVAAFRKRKVSFVDRSLGHGDDSLPSASYAPCFYCEDGSGLAHTGQFRYLDKASIPDELDMDTISENQWRLCTLSQVEKVKLLLRMVPIWTSCLMYGVVFAQPSTFFTKQGKTMERTIAYGFQLPAASLRVFISLTAVLLLPVYDRLFAPLCRKLTGKEGGITVLQRMGFGIFLCVLSMVAAGIVETRRLKTASDYGQLDEPSATVPISICWLLPQYVLIGVADVFIKVGLQEFFYDQMPDGLRSLGAAIEMSIVGLGSFMSSILISMIENWSTARGGNWFSDNLNQAHLDYFYWLLALLSGVSLCFYMYFAHLYIFK